MGIYMYVCIYMYIYIYIYNLNFWRQSKIKLFSRRFDVWLHRLVLSIYLSIYLYGVFIFCIGQAQGPSALPVALSKNAIESSEKILRSSNWKQWQAWQNLRQDFFTYGDRKVIIPSVAFIIVPTILRLRSLSE